MSGGEFQRVEKTGERMYGPRKLLVCGFPAGERKFFTALLAAAGLKDIPVLFAADEDLSATLAGMLKRGASEERDGASTMHRAGIMSGFTQEELHCLLKGYRESGLPAILWATLTPVSEKWLLKDLLDELAAEAEAFKKRKRGDQ